MEFYTHPDYVLNSTREIQVIIPRVTQKHVGRYVCLTLQSDNYEECTFTLKKHEVTTHGIISSTLTDLHDNRTIHVIRQRDDYLRPVIMGVLGAIAFICSAVLITTICIIFRTRCAPDVEQCRTDEKPNNGVRGETEYKDKKKISSQGNGGSYNKVNTDAMKKPLLNLVETLRLKEISMDIESSLSYDANV